MVAQLLNLVLVKAIKEPQPEFKLHSMKAFEIDKTCALSSVPFGVFLVENIHSYIHCKLEELGDKYIRNEFNGFYDNDQLKP